MAGGYVRAAVRCPVPPGISPWKGLRLESSSGMSGAVSCHLIAAFFPILFSVQCAPLGASTAGGLALARDRMGMTSGL